MVSYSKVVISMYSSRAAKFNAISLSDATSITVVICAPLRRNLQCSNSMQVQVVIHIRNGASHARVLGRLHGNKSTVHISTQRHFQEL